MTGSDFASTRFFGCVYINCCFAWLPLTACAIHLWLWDHSFVWTLSSTHHVLLIGQAVQLFSVCAEPQCFSVLVTIRCSIPRGQKMGGMEEMHHFWPSNRSLKSVVSVHSWSSLKSNLALKCMCVKKRIWEKKKLHKMLNLNFCLKRSQKKRSVLYLLFTAVPTPLRLKSKCTKHKLVEIVITCIPVEFIFVKVDVCEPISFQVGEV